MSIKVENITFTYMQGTPYERQALQQITLEINKGEFVAIIGHTGSGKSTLVQHLNGLLKPSTGRVLINDVNLADKKKSKEVRRCVGMVFQYPEHQLFAETIYEDIAFGPRNLQMSEIQVEEQVREAMRFVGLDYEGFKDRSPFQLSGGQMRRVAIAGVVAMQPDFLILDEPSAGLDPKAKKDIFQEIYKLYKSKNISIILVTHNMEEAAKYAKRILVMSEGQIVCDDSPEKIFLERLNQLNVAGVDIPDVVKLSNKLKARGLISRQYNATTAELQQDVCQTMRGKKK